MMRKWKRELIFFVFFTLQRLDKIIRSESDIIWADARNTLVLTTKYPIWWPGRVYHLVNSIIRRFLQIRKRTCWILLHTIEND
jgi:hypothetical protein